MTSTDLIKFLRQSVLVQDTDVTPLNPDYLVLADEDIRLLLEIALTKVDAGSSIDALDDGHVYPLILMAKKELFHRLALPKATKYSLRSSGARLDKNQIFDHYMALIDDVNKEYTEWLATGVPVSSANIFLDSRYFTLRNYNNAKAPIVTLSEDTLYQDKVEVSWLLSRVSKFHSYSLYIGSTSNVDEYSKDLILPTAKAITTLYDIHQTKFRVENLTPNTTYYVTLVAKECNNLKGYSEITITTLP